MSPLSPRASNKENLGGKDFILVEIEKIVTCIAIQKNFCLLEMFFTLEHATFFFQSNGFKAELIQKARFLVVLDTGAVLQSFNELCNYLYLFYAQKDFYSQHI